MKQMSRPFIRSLVCVFSGLFFCIFALSPAYAIVRLDTVGDQDYIDLGDSFPSVGELASNGSIRGSGSLISDGGGGASRWVLTAAHIGTPNQFTINGNTHNVVNFTRHPDFDGSGGGGITDTGLENDIAIAELETSLSGLSPLSWHDNDNDLTAGVNVISVGFGNAGTGDTGEESGTSGTKRGGENTIDAIGSTSPLTPVETAFEYRFFAPDNEDARQLEASAATFDSGGPVVADFGNGNTIVGVHSYVQNNDGGNLATYGDDTGATRVTLFDDWIVQQIPEPKATALTGGLLVLAACLLGRRAGFPGNSKSS